MEASTDRLDKDLAITAMNRKIIDGKMNPRGLPEEGIAIGYQKNILTYFGM